MELEVFNIKCFVVNGDFTFYLRRDRDVKSCLWGWMSAGTVAVRIGKMLKLLRDSGGMGIRVVGTVGDEYEYTSPCSCLIQPHN